MHKIICSCQIMYCTCIFIKHADFDESITKQNMTKCISFSNVFCTIQHILHKSEIILIFYYGTLIKFKMLGCGDATE